MLFPQHNTFRSVIDLGGTWRFLPDVDDKGEDEKWFAGKLADRALLIAVPGAWNEQLAEQGLMNFVGRCWYEKEFVIQHIDPRTHRLILRIGGAEHCARVWLNGGLVGEHAGGYLPFEIDLTDALLAPGERNRLVMWVDSRLSMDTIPQGIDPNSSLYAGNAFDRRHVYPATRFDFFPYGGLTRPVQLCIVPVARLLSIAIRGTLEGNVELSVDTIGDRCTVVASILDEEDRSVTKDVNAEVRAGRASASLTVRSPRLWSPSQPYLYSVRLSLIDASGKEIDQYIERFGFREIRVDGGTLLLNRTPLYLVGFGKHEDVPIVGRGQFRPSTVRDFELMRWMGANSFRTSHYPYDEEVIQLADRMGFLVIDETAAVSLGFVSDRFEDLLPLLENHRKALTELIGRDRNHPSVISWSIANEPNLWNEPHYQTDAGRRYFRTLYDHVRQLDPSRPVIAITMPAFSVDDISLEACDIIGINRYFGWYTDPVDLAKARLLLDREMDAMFKRHGKPVIVTECGVDTIEGYHATVPQMFTEEYQTEFLRVYSSVADAKPFCAGFHVWNFADFLTPQHFRRVIQNRKGVFTRTREPKSAAFFLRSHWTSLARVAAAHRPKRHADTPLIEDIKPPR